MCILFIYCNPNADAGSYKLILATNRDEMLKRPALPAHYWNNHPKCLGGIDMEPGREGGTWFGLSTTGKAGIILNLIDAQGSNESKITKGRGFLIPNYITSKDSPENYLTKLHNENQNGHPYNPYQLILVDLQNTHVYCLTSSENSPGYVLCKDTILGFGNSDMEHPYEKVKAGKKKFQNIVNNSTVSKENALIEDLIQLLKSGERYLPDPELEKRCPAEYKELSSIFVSSEEYGTRTHSVLLVSGSNDLTFVEETLTPDSTWKRQSFKTALSKDES